MHDAARDYIASYSARLCFTDTILEIGGRDINGGLRDLWPRATWTSVDLYPGPGVDVVADFRAYEHPEKVDLVICCEVFEHTPHWPQLIQAARDNLKEHGVLLITTATGNRKPHSAIDGGELREGEHYANIKPRDLLVELNKHFSHVSIDLKGADIRAHAQTRAIYICPTCNQDTENPTEHRCRSKKDDKGARREGRT